MNRIKLLVMVTCSFFSTLTACGGQDLKENSYFLLLKDKGTISLNTYENGEIKEQKTFPISTGAIFATDQKERVAILYAAKKSIVLYEIQTSKETKLSMPYDMKPECILLNNENLFIGGKMGKEMLVQYHIQNRKWYRLEIPEEISWQGKAVDDLVMNDSLLIAIDNIIIPKYVLFYRLNTTGRLALSHFKELKPNSSYEIIRQGRITPEYFGLISETMNHGNFTEHITIYAGLDLKRSFAISAGFRQKRNFNDFLLVGDKLFIANSEKGLGLFEIRDSCFQARDRGNAGISEDKINYRPYKNEEIIRLTAIPDETKIILTIRNIQGEIRHEIIDGLLRTSQ